MLNFNKAVVNRTYNIKELIRNLTLSFKLIIFSKKMVQVPLKTGEARKRSNKYQTEGYIKVDRVT